MINYFLRKSISKKIVFTIIIAVSSLFLLKDYFFIPKGRIAYAYQPYLNNQFIAATTEIYITDPWGLRKQRLTKNNFYDTMPKISPDGKKILFMSVRKESEKGLIHDLFLMDIDGKNERQLTFGDGDWRWHSWLPDSQRVLFHTREEWAMLAIDTGRKELLKINETEGEIMNIVFSPDGKRVLFSPLRYDSQNQSSHAGLWISSSEGNNKFNLFEKQSRQLYFAWAPDGEKIGIIDYEYKGEGRIGPVHDPWLILVNAETGAEIKRFLLNHFVTNFSFSPDGRWVVADGENSIYLINLETQKELCIAGKNFGIIRDDYRFSQLSGPGESPHYYFPDWR